MQLVFLCQQIIIKLDFNKRFGNSDFSRLAFSYLQSSHNICNRCFLNVYISFTTKYNVLICNFPLYIWCIHYVLVILTQDHHHHHKDCHVCMIAVLMVLLITIWLPGRQHMHTTVLLFVFVFVSYLYSHLYLYFFDGFGVLLVLFVFEFCWYLYLYIYSHFVFVFFMVLLITIWLKRVHTTDITISGTPLTSWW